MCIFHLESFRMIYNGICGSFVWHIYDHIPQNHLKNIAYIYIEEWSIIGEVDVLIYEGGLSLCTINHYNVPI